MTRRCLHCGKEDVDLRPYGPNGADVCFPCAMDVKHPERKAEADRQMAKRFLAPGTVILVPGVGPVSASSTGDKN